MISLLIESAIRSTALALAVGAILCLCRVRDAGIRLAAWTAVLCGVLLLPFLGAVLPRVAIPLIPSAQIAKVTTLPISAHPDPGMVRLSTMPQTRSAD